MGRDKEVDRDTERQPARDSHRERKGQRPPREWEASREGKKTSDRHLRRDRQKTYSRGKDGGW